MSNPAEVARRPRRVSTLIRRTTALRVGPFTLPTPPVTTDVVTRAAPDGPPPPRRSTLSVRRGLTVREKLLGSYGLLIVLVLAMVAVAVSVASTARTHAGAASSDVALTTAVKQLQLDSASVAVAENSVAFDYSSHGPATGDLQSFSAGSAAYIAEAVAVRRFPLTPAQTKDLDAAGKAFAGYVSLSSEINTDFARDTKASDAAAGTGVAALSFSTVTKPLDGLVTSVAHAVGHNTSGANSSASSGEQLALVVGALALLVAITSASIITRAITKPIRAIHRTLSDVIAGNLESRANVKTHDELGEVASSLNRAISSQAAARVEIEASARAQSAASADNAAVIEVLRALHGATNAADATSTTLTAIADELGWSSGAFWSSTRDHELELHSIVGTALDANGQLGSRSAPASLARRSFRDRSILWSDASAPDVDCERITAARNCGFDISVALPVVVGGAVAGILEFHGIGGGLEVDQWRRTAMRNVGEIVSQCFERISVQEREHAAERELRAKVDTILTVVSSAADGDLTVDVSVTGGDAIGQVGRGLTDLLGDLRRRVSTIGETSAGLTAATGALLATSSQMSATSTRTSDQSAIAASSSDAVLSQVESVSSAVDELTASIGEIAKNSAAAAGVALEATNVAEDTNTIVRKLGVSSGEVGAVVKVITTIAEQTNLLALNATIEAARAGEAGRGFAVVAGEVKELARETAMATEDIAIKIGAIQTDADSAIEAIGRIKAIIDRISELQSAIAAAVTQQTATTNEIARSVSGAAASAGEISATAGEVASAAGANAEAAATTASCAGELARMSEELSALVARFRY